MPDARLRAERVRLRGQIRSRVLDSYEDFDVVVVGLDRPIKQTASGRRCPARNRRPVEVQSIPLSAHGDHRRESAHRRWSEDYWPNISYSHQQVLEAAADRRLDDERGIDNGGR